MKKSVKAAKLLIGAAVVAVLALGLMLARHMAARYEEAGQPDLLLPLTADRIAAVRYRSGNGTEVSFKREDGVWTAADDDEGLYASGVDQTEAGALAASLTGVRLEHTLTDVTDLSEYGLDSPRYEVTVTDTGGQVSTIEIGADNDTTASVYCFLNQDRTMVYAVSPSILSSLVKGPDEYAAGADSEETDRDETDGSEESDSEEADGDKTDGSEEADSGNG